MTLYHHLHSCPWIKNLNPKKTTKCVPKSIPNFIPLLPGLFSLLIKVLSVSSITSSIWSFIVSCCSLILLLPNVLSSEGLFRYGTCVFSRYGISDMSLVLGQFSGKHFSAALALPALLAVSWGLWLIQFSGFWKVFNFLLSFFSIPSNNILCLVPENFDLSGNIISEGVWEMVC